MPCGTIPPRNSSLRPAATPSRTTRRKAAISSTGMATSGSGSVLRTVAIGIASATDDGRGSPDRIG